MSTFNQILENKIVAIVRGVPLNSILPIAQALYNGGIRLLEITLNSPGALEAIKVVSSTFNDRLIVGAGTVLDAYSADSAINQGALFIISPNFDRSTINITRKRNAVSIPGAFTPTEILRAFQEGGEIIKVFPAILGPAYLSDIRAPLPHIPLMPTGGVTLDNIKSFHATGAVAFGIGSALVNARETLNDQWLEQLQQKAAAFVKTIHTQQTP
jgi:2-dehydro-3-deoxyphosphogluconate aldolase/(4S)-4-hydroxy-2-oxoglutarate aldolase